MSPKKWIEVYLLLVFIPLICISPVVPVVDPYFHYHKPLTEKFFYGLDGGQRYINNGITRNFDYDALITGTSMTENFKSSEFDELFGCKSIKVPFSGGSFFEINRNQEAAFKNHDVRYMLRSIDYTYLNSRKDEMPTTAANPTFLYNEFTFDDLNYLWSKDAIWLALDIVKNGAKGKRGIRSFDEYSNWNKNYTFGSKSVLEGRTEFKSPRNVKVPKEAAFQRIKENVMQNVVQLALDHPDCEFYYFFPPYSIVAWGESYEGGELEKKLQYEAFAIDLILQCDNIQLFSFNTKYEWILNLDNYKDSAHYGEWINSRMLHLMKAGECRITKENVDQYLREEREFYTNFDYNSIFK
ncbi:MAG: hypothetical protein IJU95_10105 [Treponema sp.]|nr:hypothetical protein [Treponema sp.]